MEGVAKIIEKAPPPSSFPDEHSGNMAGRFTTLGLCAATVEGRTAEVADPDKGAIASGHWRLRDNRPHYLLHIS